MASQTSLKKDAVNQVHEAVAWLAAGGTARVEESSGLECKGLARVG